MFDIMKNLSKKAKQRFGSDPMDSARKAHPLNRYGFDDYFDVFLPHPISYSAWKFSGCIQLACVGAVGIEYVLY